MTSLVDPDIRPMIEAMIASGRPAIYDMSITEARAMADAIYDPWTPKIDVLRSETRIADNVKIKIHWPREASGGGSLAVALCFHGGGWALGNVESHSLLAREYAARGGVIVVDVDYRLAPEYKFPAAIEDGLAVLHWAHRNAASIGGDPERIGFIGESAGANIAVGICIAARDKLARLPTAIAAVVPCMTLALNTAFESRTLFDAREYMLTRRHMQWFRELYLASPADAEDARASPLQARDLTGFPSTTIITSECDILRDEGAAFVMRLVEAGVSVDYRCVSGGVHGSIGLGPDVRSGHETLELVAKALHRF